jgi:hypothetical protein
MCYMYLTTQRSYHRKLLMYCKSLSVIYEAPALLAPYAASFALLSTLSTCELTLCFLPIEPSSSS